MKQLEIQVRGANLFTREVSDKNEAQSLLDDFTDGAMWEAHLNFVYCEYDENWNLIEEEIL